MARFKNAAAEQAIEAPSKHPTSRKKVSRGKKEERPVPRKRFLSRYEEEQKRLEQQRRAIAMEKKDSPSNKVNSVTENIRPKFTVAHQLSVLMTFKNNAYLPGEEALLTREEKKLIAEFKKLSEEKQKIKLNELTSVYNGRG